MDGTYVQWGCGMSAPAGWINFDASPTLRFERIPILGRLYTKNPTRFPENIRFGDIVRGLPVAPDSCQGMYCAHVLEHLSLEDARVALRNSRRYLKPGAVFRLVLPDLEQMARNYLSSPSAQAAHAFIRNTDLGRERRPRGLRALLISILGGSAHQWMWDYKSLEAELTDAGFRDIRRATWGDSEDPKFLEVEHDARFEGCVAVQCRK